MMTLTSLFIFDMRDEDTEDGNCNLFDLYMLLAAGRMKGR